MKLTVDGDILNEAIGFTTQILPSTVRNISDSGVLFKASLKDSGKLILSANTRENSTRIAIPANVEEAGEVLIPGQKLHQITAALSSSSKPGNKKADGKPSASETEEINMSLIAPPDGYPGKDQIFLINKGSFEFLFEPLAREKYPSPPDYDDVDVAEMELVPFLDAISQVWSSASRDDTNVIPITGVQLRFSEDTLELNATDRYRVANSKIPLLKGIGEREIVVTAKTLMDVSRSLPKNKKGKVRLLLDRGKQNIFGVEYESGLVSSVVLAGNYPEVKKLFKEESGHKIVFNKQAMLNAIKVLGVPVETGTGLKFTFKKEEILIECLSGGGISSRGNIPGELTGDEITLVLQPRYLNDGLGGCDSEVVEAHFSPSVTPKRPGPILIRPKVNKNSTPSEYKYLLQPNLLLG